ncbi:MAG: hypothetical protein QOK03_1943, partial [Candidatus Binataceae bacterium]|nr:hypothetical protein [Candidatus Binataceae bacterium]
FDFQCLCKFAFLYVNLRPAITPIAATAIMR